MGFYMVPLYIIRIVFNHGACPYTWALWYMTRGFNLSFHIKKYDELVMLTKYFYKSLRINTIKTLGGY